MAEPAHALGSFEPRSLVGATLDERYELVGHLATGGMGAVFKARHVHLRKDVAVKVLRPDLTSSPDIVERFRREAEIASALEHDNIVRVTDFGRTPDGYLFLVMELLSGESLFDRLRREGALTPEEAVPILWQVCAGLAVAHGVGVVHRDLKPENVFLARTSSGREVAKVLDFGIAKIADPTSECSTQSGVVVGTPEYLSPEQAMGTPVDGRADVYAVGLIAWRTLAGRHPFKADDARGLLMMQATRPVPPLADARPDLAAYPALVAAVEKACAKDPEARHQTASALADDLAAALGPAFLMPPGATPSPSISLTSAVTSPAVMTGGHSVPSAFGEGTSRSFEAGGTERLRPPVPPLAPGQPPPAAPLVMTGGPAVTAPLPPRAAGAPGAVPRPPGGVPASPGPPGAAPAEPLAAWLGRVLRRNPMPALAVAAVALVVAAALALQSWRGGRPAAEARALLAANRPRDARAVVEAALARRPADRELLLLRGRVLHRIPGAAGEGIDAYAAARATGPLDAAAHEDLVAALGRERALADRAARVLVDEGAAALPAVLRAAATAPGLHRLRALAVARDLGAEDRVSRADAYGELLGDADCDVRRAAARRLGEIGDPAALPRLRRAAQARAETRGFLGAVRLAPACGAAEAEAAVRRVEAARR